MTNSIDPSRLPPPMQYPVAGPTVPLDFDIPEIENDDRPLLDEFMNDHAPMPRKHEWWRLFILVGVAAIVLLALARGLGVI